MNFKDILFLNKMVTPIIITVIYWIVEVFVIIAGLFTMFGQNFFYGLGILIAGTIAVRLWCELIILAFKIYETLNKIANNQANTVASAKTVETTNTIE